MELEEMKAQWGEMSVEMEKQKKLTGSLIIKMTRVNYNNKLSKIFIPEAIGSAVGFGIVVFILINIRELNTWYLMVCGIVSALILVILPVLSIRSILKMRSVNISANNYKQSLLEYSKGKIRFVFAQKLTFYLGAILMLTSLPVMGALIAHKDVFKVASVWYWYVIAFPLFYWFAKWVFKSYIKMLAGAENILKELEVD